MSRNVIEESSTVTSNSVKYRLKHKWTIKDFAATYLVESSNHDSCQQLCSTWFGSSQDKETQFKVTLEPKSQFAQKNCITVTLYRDPPFTSYFSGVDGKFSLLDDLNEKCFTKDYIKKTTLSLGFANYQAHSLLLDPDNGLLPAGQLTILTEIDVYQEPVGQFVNELFLAKCNWEAKENVTVSLGSLLNSGDHSDIVLVLEKGALFAHKNILSLHSPVFSAMFKSEMVERIPIPEMKQMIVEKMLEFIYKGYVSDLDYCVEDLYQAADKYGITRLKALCCQCLCDKVSQDNAAALLAFADRHSVDQLKRTCVEFIGDLKMKDVVLTDDWPLVEKLFTEELRQLIVKEDDEEEFSKEEANSDPLDSPKYRLRHKWIIQKFAFTFLGESLDEGTYPRIHTVWFSSSIDRQIQFRLHLKPRGRSEMNQSAIALFLEVKNNCPEMCMSTEVKYTLSLLNERNQKCYSREHRREFQNSEPSWGISSFLHHTRLLKPSNGLLPADQLTILAEIDVFPNQLESESPLGRIQMAARENVSSSLGTLLDSGDFSDVVLVVNGEELVAHKNILSAHSPVFSSMFKSTMMECEEDRVLISDMEIDVTKVFLRFIYTGDLEDLEMYAQELLLAADKYGVTRLKALCSQYLCGRVDMDNVAAMLTLADCHSVDQLKKTCVQYICDHWQEVIVSKDWPLVDKLFIEELKQKEKEETEKIAEEKIPEEWEE